MNYQIESKFQCWRAIAVCNGREALVHLGRSSEQVRTGYALAFEELFDAAEPAAVLQIVLQCWTGVADQGHWATKAVLPIPKLIRPTQTLLRSGHPRIQERDGSKRGRRLADTR